ncbi:MAG: hypothetical protein IJ475_02040 [Bacilli bacterium]|nr:hypothetical protein [Bacilli bacterium]
MVELVDFVENKNFRRDFMISYLSVLVKNKDSEEFLKGFNECKSCIQSIVSEGLNSEMLEKVKAIIAYYDEVNHGLSI